MPPEPASPIITRRSLYSAGALLVAVAASVVVMGLTTRKMADAKLREWTEEQALPVVAVAPPSTRSTRLSFELPGRLEAYTQAQIYARVSGYLKDWKADIGTPVKAGDLLGEIDAPDLDQQIMQAQADLGSAQANSKLADATLVRGQQLITSGAISKQDLDQRAADSANKQGLVRSAQANLDRLHVLEQYKRITAPFDGLVTARSTDIGALINAGNGGGPPLFVVSDTSRLRVYVNVPQSYVPSVKVGTKAELSVPEYPNRKFFATVEASAQAVDIASGATRMLLVVDNSSGALMTGGFTAVTFELARPATDFNVAASALIFDRSGLRVAVVDNGNHVALKDVTIARDLGKEVEIASGLAADDRVIQSPPDGIQNGDLVRVAGEVGSNVQANAVMR
jgi:RND family efflux transporter MFP subunit